MPPTPTALAVTDLANRAEREIKFFEGIKSFSALPRIVDWWSARYLRPRIMQIFETAGPYAFYATPIEHKAARSPKVRAISLGSGDGEVEVLVARYLINRNVTNFTIMGIELSAALVARATARAEREGVSSNVTFLVGDLNEYDGQSEFDFVVANQILHHVVNLEALIEKIHEVLVPDGMLMTRDMIGRNGHQAWPEAKQMIDQLWADMPSRYKYHQVYKRNFPSFPNFHFASTSFEGIRSQDILPLLIQKFSFQRFYAFGGVVERFVNRGFGSNYDPDNEDDRSFVVCLQTINDMALDAGAIKPTQIAAWLVKEPCQTRQWLGRSPEFCVRTL
jgi:2-polyprenyl-3-methyl-5-hydroxy-6-metoxy-1,4-benzoquinol methylase